MSYIGKKPVDFNDVTEAQTFSVTGDLTVDTDTLHVDSTNNQVGVGTVSPVRQLHLHATSPNNTYLHMTGNATGSTIADGFDIVVTNSTGEAILIQREAQPISFRTSGTERMRIDSSGKVGIGITSAVDRLHLHSTAAETNGIRLSNSATGSTSSDGFQIYAGSTGQAVLRQRENDSMVMMTNNTERMRIVGNGAVLIAQTANDSGVAGHIFNANGSAFHVRDSGTVFVVNRLTNDGDLVHFRQDGTTEGSISVSGTTVELNGAHLTRWAQLSDGSKDTSILRGTVMTNLDQMAVWSHDAVAATYYVDGDYLPEITPATYYTEDDTLPDGVSVGDEKTAAVYAQVGDEKTPAKDAYTEDNEQLNCVAVSSVEGDPNVAGVLSSWDDDDDQFNDMKIGMTGDMVIRIAQGTTVARGDLLMSAGDGTAKPQGDDIVRSKTIAKVTSTNVSHTYDDGSYLVPCVLMAC